MRISLISEKIVLMCNDYLLWWLVETRLILQESLLELLLVLGTLAPIKVDVLRTWSPPISFNCPSAVFGIVTKLGEIISFALSFTLWNSDASIFVHLLKVCYQKSSFPNFSPRGPDVFGECFGQCYAPELVEFQQVKNRNWVIFIPTNQVKFFDSTDSSKRLSLGIFRR